MPLLLVACVTLNAQLQPAVEKEQWALLAPACAFVAASACVQAAALLTQLVGNNAVSSATTLMFCDCVPSELNVTVPVAVPALAWMLTVPQA